MILTARYVLPMTDSYIVDGAVLVRDGSILEVGDRDALLRAHPEEEVRDFGLACIMPGFIDLHTHLEYSAMRGLVDDVPYSQWKLQLLEREKRLSPADWDDAALLGIAEALQSGITTIADITKTGASVRAVHATGARGVIYREVSTMDKTRVPAVLGSACDDIDAWSGLVDPARIEVGIAPHAPYSCHPHVYEKVAELAVARGLPVAMHLAGSQDEYDFVKYGSSRLAVDFREAVSVADLGWLPTGVSPVRYVGQWGILNVPRVLAIHCTHVDDADIGILAENKVSIAYCPRCNAKLAMGTAPLAKFVRSGIAVGLGTDSPASNNTLDMFDEMRIGLLIQRAMLGFEPYLVARSFLKLATSDAARALGVEERVGTLEPGKLADVIAVDVSHSHQIPTLNPYSTLVHAANQENVMMTMVGGEVLYERGVWTHLDHERVWARADEIRVALRT